MISVLSVIGIMVWQRSDTTNTKLPKLERTGRQADLDIQGLTLEKVVQGKRVYRLRLGSMQLGKKTLGIFEIGGMRQIEINNLDCTIYLPAALSIDSAKTNTARRGSLFDDLRESFSGLAGSEKNISGMVADNVVFRMLCRNKPVLKIRSSELSFSWRKGALEFSKHARLYQQGQITKHKHIVLDFRTMQLIVENDRTISFTPASSNCLSSGQQFVR